MKVHDKRSLWCVCGGWLSYDGPEYDICRQSALGCGVLSLLEMPWGLVLATMGQTCMGKAVKVLYTQ
jgi:hypothetical protein